MKATAPMPYAKIVSVTIQYGEWILLNVLNIAYINHLLTNFTLTGDLTIGALATVVLGIPLMVFNVLRCVKLYKEIWGEKTTDTKSSDEDADSNN